MRRIRALLVDAFTEEPLAGNVAGVVPDAEGLAEPQMRAVAGELGASETAFLLPSSDADHRVRFFTPTTEVDLCGHATVAIHAHLHEAGRLGTGTHRVETAAGVLDVEVADDGTVWLTGAPPEVRRVAVDRARVAEATDIDPAAIDAVDELPLAVASVGVPFLMVPVGHFEPLRLADPDRAAVVALSNELDAAGVYAFTFDTLGAESTLHGRAWAPAVGVPEDPVTGTASGAVGAYLRHVGAIDPWPDELVCEQGDVIGRPGRVHVRVGETVRVGGRAVTALDGTLAVPEPPADDIIEA